MDDTNARVAVFLGRITSGITLELRNALATIMENAEILEDYSQYGEDVDFPNKEKFSQAMSVIKDQVLRGADLATRLNNFARGPDDPASEIDLNELLEVLIYLWEPAVRTEGVTLSVIPGDHPLIVLTNPMKIQMVLFDCIEFLTKSVGIKGTLNIRARPGGEEAVMVDFSSPDREQPPDRDAIELIGSTQWDELQDSAKSVNGWIVLRDTPSWFTVVFKRGLI